MYIQYNSFSIIVSVSQMINEFHKRLSNSNFHLFLMWCCLFQVLQFIPMLFWDLTDKCTNSVD